MLTEERLREIEELGELAFDGSLIKEISADVVPYIRTLQQQNKQLVDHKQELIDGLETASMWLNGAEMHIKASQLRMLLESIRGNTP